MSCRTVRLIFRVQPSADAQGSWRTDLCQVLSILTMERPFSFSAEDIRDEKVRRTRRIELKLIGDW